MIQQRKLSFVLSVFVLSGLMVACAAGPGAEDTIRFGVIQPLTGPVADAGAYVLHGLTIGLEKINAEGGVCGKLLEPVVLDGRNDPQESANAAENLIAREKVPIIMGAWGSSATLAVMPVMERHGVPLVVETSSSQKITTPGTPGFEWVHRISATSAMEAEAATPYLVDVLGMNNVAILSVNNDWGLGAGEVFRQAIEELGGRIISEDYIDQAAIDVLPQLTKIKGSEADAILITTGAGQIATILKQYNELGMDQTIRTTGGGTYHLMFYVPTAFDLAGDPEISEWYYKEYTERGYPEVGRGESYRGFEAVHVIAKAIELNDCSLDSQGLNDALTHVEFAGLSGSIRFDHASGRQNRPNVYLVRVEDGQLKPLQGPHSVGTAHELPED